MVDKHNTSFGHTPIPDRSKYIQDKQLNALKMFGPKLGKRFLNVIALIEKKPKEKHIRANFVIKGEPHKEVPKEEDLVELE